MAKPKLTVTLPGGTLASRRTDREYTHVLAVKGGTDNVWSAHSWHGTYGRAVDALIAFSRRQPTLTYKCGPGEPYYVEPGSPRVVPVKPV
jgi:hypothetical protein